MKKIFKKIVNSIKDFFSRMADQEAEGLIEFYQQISEYKPSEGGERLKISGKSYDR